jgi:glycosyltransferase involved in cell wall biosynthesis
MTTATAPRPILCLNLYATMGGAERALLELASALDPARFVPLVVIAAEGPLAARLRQRGIEVVIERFPALPLYAFAWPPTAWRLAVAALRLTRLVRERGIRLLQCGDVLGLLLLLPSVRAGARVIYQVNYLGHGPRLRLFGLLARSAEAIVACSQWQRGVVTRAAPRLAGRTLVVHPGVETADFAAGRGGAFRRELGVPNGAPLVGMLGRYDVWKGHQLFLEAAARVLERRPEALFAMIGGALNSDSLRHVDAYQRRVLARRDSLGLREKVRVVDHRDDLPDVLAALDVVVLPSKDEPFGMVLVEAMAAGRPVVAADSGGPKEIVQDNATGLLFRSGDAAALADAVLALLDDPERARALGEAGRGRARDVFHRNRYARKMEALYERLA